MFLAEMLLGVVGPIVMFLIPRVRNNQFGLFVASLMVVLGFVMNRINVAITGMDRSSGVNYFPSWTELAVTASIVGAGFLLFGLAVKYLDVFPREEMDEIARGKRSELPVLAAFRQPLWSATTLALVAGLVVMGATVALSYDGIRRRVPAQTERATEKGDVNIDAALVDLRIPGPVAIKMGTTSPGLVTFSHARHVDASNPSCTGCHTGLFKMLPTNADISPGKKMQNCGHCHDGVKAVSTTNKERCDSCHARH
jgi:c(7)-type cytochrome triheme protein